MAARLRPVRKNQLCGMRTEVPLLPKDAGLRRKAQGAEYSEPLDYRLAGDAQSPSLRGSSTWVL